MRDTGGPTVTMALEDRMTGAESLLRTAAACGITVCFANPGTSEMHFLAALDAVPAIRPVLGLFEGGVTGMADGFARVTGRPALTLLHLGTGLSNGTANLHNARRARSPVVNVVGEHASYHNRWDSPLRTDIAALARPASDWLRTCAGAAAAATDVALAVVAAQEAPGRIATLILPADAAWGMCDGAAGPLPAPPPAWIDMAATERAAIVLEERGPSSVILVSRAAGSEAGLGALERVCAVTGARPMADMIAARQWRGAGVFPVSRVPYRAEDVVSELAGMTDLVLVGTAPPVAPFAYPDYPSWCVPDGTAILCLAQEHEDEVLALEALADRLGAAVRKNRWSAPPRPDRPSGSLTARSVGRSIARHLPEGSIVSEEAISNGPAILAEMAAAARHLHLPLTGGAIGQGIPLATGAAVGAPDTKVLNIQADGSAMYTLQALWTQAREGLDVVTVILANRAYGVLKAEVERVGARLAGNARAAALLQIDNPTLDFVALAAGMGVAATRAATAEAFDDQLAEAMGQRGPRLIEAVLA